MNNIIYNRFRVAKLSWLVVLTFVAAPINAQDFFNPKLLELSKTNKDKINLSRFETGGQAPGTYRVDILLEGRLVDSRDVVFFLGKDNTGKENLQPCLSVDLLKSFGVNTDIFPALKPAAGSQCANIAAIPQASAEFIFSSQQLVISIPQAALLHVPRGYVPSTKWDEGIPALLLNYSFNGSQNSVRGDYGHNNNNQFLNLRPGMNLGAWRLRNYSTWSRDSNGEDKWNTVYSYAQRDIIGLNSQLILGDSSSPSDIFDSVPFRGMQVASDDEMLPESLRGYAPVIRGIARSNAQVIVRQNGYNIYQSYVAPGAFEITDMYPTGSSGDLQVTIKESDGSEQHSTIPFASLPVLQREGRVKYSITGGQYRAYSNNVEKTPFGQITGIYGLPYDITLYGGNQMSSKYQSLALGIGKNMGDFGALSSDMTQAWSMLQDDKKTTGQSWRLRYSKNVIETGTNFAIAGYRYSTDGFYGLQEVLDSYRDWNAWLPERRRNRAEMLLNQRLGSDFGALTFNLVNEDYWDSQRRMQSIGLGYNNNWGGISYSLNYSYNRYARGYNSSSDRRIERDQIVAFNISVPLDRWLSNTRVNYGLNSSQRGSTTNTLGVNGSLLDDKNLSWSVQQGYSSKGEGNSGQADIDYRGTYGEFSTGYGYDRYARRINYGIQGGIVAHADGITLGQPLGETVALVKATGAAGVSVNNQTGVRTDFRGYTLVPYVSPYRENDISLDPETLANNVDLSLTNSTVVPTRGAVVKADFDVRVGNRVLMTLRLPGSDVVPFGAIATQTSSDIDSASIVGDRGEVYLTGLPEKGSLLVQWGPRATEQCQVDYQLEQQPEQNVSRINTLCHLNK